MLVYLQMIDTEEDRHKFEIIYEEYRQTMIKVAYKFSELLSRIFLFDFELLI